MCKHQLIKIGSVRACKKCGLTMLENGIVMYDKELVKMYQKGAKHEKQRKHLS